MKDKPFTFSFTLNTPILGVCLLAILLTAFFLHGLARYEAGREFIWKEAVALGYAEYYFTNSTQSFRWLCDSPAVEGVVVVEGCRCFSEEGE